MNLFGDEERASRGGCAPWIELVLSVALQQARLPNTFFQNQLKIFLKFIRRCNSLGKITRTSITHYHNLRINRAGFIVKTRLSVWIKW